MSLAYQHILDTIYQEIQPLLSQGKVATYIPELSKISPQRFGMAVVCLDGSSYAVGDAHQKFSTQSITKLFALALAFEREGNAIWQRVGREPSGNPFRAC
ncbi:MAG: glutaminase [Burkholderiales bacterium]|nr:glutaminase [Burkholderiales bacterium]